MDLELEEVATKNGQPITDEHYFIFDPARWRFGKNDENILVVF